MNSIEERLAALEQSTARIEGLLLELKTELAQPTRVRVRKSTHFDPQPAIRAAIDERTHTLAVGLKLAASCVLLAVLVWVGIEVYQNLTRGLPLMVDAPVSAR
jgi:hypothetical protein